MAIRHQPEQQEGTNFYTNLWVSRIFEFSMPHRPCPTFAHAHTKQHFDRTVSSLLPELLLETLTLSGRESGEVDWAVSVFRIYKS